MALAAFFALTTEDDIAEVRRVGWIYLVATHMGTLTLFVLFALWRRATGSFDLSAAQGLSPSVAGALFALTVVGFSFKAGLMPLHVWLPGAHANAPCHVSAVMSGVLIKMGIYGIVRMTGLLSCGAPWWGAALLAAGALSSVLGIATATAQRDIKRVLAYSSIENVGIISMGIGLALLGRSFARPELVVLGLGGALLHVINHSLFKPLLFLNSGSILHGAHTRDMEQMGGLAKKMPATAFLFLVGAAAISALPPLNGFAGEWMLYLGFFRTLAASSAPGLALAGIAAVALAMTGALAVATFVKCYGVMFLGSPRSEAGSRAHDPGTAMTAPMVALASLCCLFGLFPSLVAPLLAKSVRAWSGGADGAIPLASLAPFGWITAAGLGLLALILIVLAFLKATGRKSPVVRGVTWDCGYAAPSGRMQYTGTSFAQTIVDLFSFALRPERRVPRIRSSFPEKAGYEIEVPDAVLDRLIVPSFAAAVALAKKTRVFQRGQTHLYILYIVVVALALLLFGGIGGAP
jgi:hydrogenase-4 component B